MVAKPELHLVRLVVRVLSRARRCDNDIIQRMPARTAATGKLFTQPWLAAVDAKSPRKSNAGQLENPLKAGLMILI